MPPAGSALRESLARRVDISDYLIPDGVSNNAEIIQRYLDDTSVGDVHIGKPGTYVVAWNGSRNVTCNGATFATCLTIPSNKKLSGVPGVKIQLSDTSDAAILMNTSGSTGNLNFGIEGIEFVGNYWKHAQRTSGTSNLYYGHGVIFVNSVDAFAINCTFTLFQKYAFYAAKYAYLTVRDCRFQQRSDCVHLNGPGYSADIQNVQGASYIVEAKFLKGGLGQNNATAFVQGEIVSDQFGNTGYFVSEAGGYVYLYYISPSFTAGGGPTGSTFITGLTSGAKRAYESYGDGVNGDNMIAFVASEGTYYRELNADANKDLYNNLVDGVNFDTSTGTYQPVRLTGYSTDTIRDNTFRNIRGKVSSGAGIALGDDNVGLLNGCVMRNNTFENISISTDGSNPAFSISGTGVKTVDIKNIRNLTVGTPMIVVTPGSGGNPALERLTIDGIEARAVTAYMVHVDNGAGAASVTDLRINGVDATIQGSNGCVIRNNGTITRLSLSNATVTGSAGSGNAILLGGGSVTDLAITNVRFNPSNQNLVSANGGTVTSVVGSNIQMRVQSATTGSRLMYIGNGGPVTQWNNVFIDASSAFANHVLEQDSATASFHQFNGLYTTGAGLRGFNLNANATMTVNVNGWYAGGHTGSATLLRSNSASAKVRLTGSGYTTTGTVSTPITVTSGTVEVNNPDFIVDASLLNGVLGDRCYSTKTGGAGGLATAGPVICNSAGIPGTATWEKNGRTF